MMVGKWQPAETAPKDGLCFIAEVKGNPYAVPCKYNRVEKGFMCLVDQTGFYFGNWDDDYFETEWAHEIIKWMPMPEVER